MSSSQTPGEENGNERHKTQQRTDQHDPEARRGRIDDSGIMPTARDHGADLLPLEGKVQGMDTGEAKKMKQPRTRTTDARGGRADAGSAEGRAVKKLPEPAGLRAAVLCRGGVRDERTARL